MNSYIGELFSCLTKVIFSVGDENFDYDRGINLLISEFLSCRQKNNVVFFVGNGGSAAIASHMTADFLKNGKIKSRSLYDSAVATCLSNDYGYEHIFSEQIRFLANEGDLLVAISSSGNSPNIVSAINVAHEVGCRVITLTGFDEDNKARLSGDVNVYVPSHKYGIVESIHNIILQQVVDTIKYKDSNKV